MAVYDLLGEKVLLKEISDGSSVAFGKMFDLYKTKIFAFVDSIVHNKADAEEIVQEVFLIIWRNREKLLSIDHPRNYIYTMARNKTYDYLAKINKNEQTLNNAWISTSVSLNNVDEQISLKESMQVINSALSKLSAQKQEIFNLSRSQYLSHEEIANMVGLSKSRVKNVIVEVLKHLKFYLSKHHAPVLLVVFSFFLK